MNGFFAGILTPVRMFWSCAAGCPLYVFFLPVLLFAFTPAEAQIIWVPDQQPTIQAAINAARSEDTIFVRPGVYFENIKFLGKSVSVVSEKGFAVTTIDGGQQDSVVTYTGGERGVLAGFTIRNGKSGFDTPGFGNGGGIRMDNGAQPDHPTEHDYRQSSM